MRGTRALIHLDNFLSNISEIRKTIPAQTKICIPVKADAYGHGALQISSTALRSGVQYLAVATAQEGCDLREAGIVSPILSLSIPLPEELPLLVQQNLIPLAADIECIDDLETTARLAGKKISIHLKIDTGMNRIGCRPSEALGIVQYIEKQKHVSLAGIATHFAVADSTKPQDKLFTKRQIEEFVTVIETIRSAGINPGIIHAANSAAVTAYPEAVFDMIRPGIAVYGYAASAELSGILKLSPVMELESRVVAIKKVFQGMSVSYGRDWIAANDTYIATIPVGYGDGLTRRLSPGLKVSINGELYPIVGKICMDQCMVDIGPDPWVQRWDTATIFGPSPLGPSAQTLADLLNTIPYEITCGINKRVPRVYQGAERRS